MSERDALAEAAVEGIEGGMIVGLGTGRAATRGIHALARRVQREGLSVRCVATSDRSAVEAQSRGLTVIPMTDVEAVDYLFDGADEVAPDLAMTKGRGGAMTREKIVAEASSKRVYLVDASKLVGRLGEKHALPVEALEFGRAAVERRLRALGLVPRVRTIDSEASGSTWYRTDEGNLVLDCDYPGSDEIDPRRLSDLIDAIPGVVGHGLFPDQADVVLIEHPATGRIERRERR